jgi:putative membrane protein
MRTLSRLFAAACAATLGLSAAAQQPAPRTLPAQPAAPGAPARPDAPPKALTDADFVTKAASGGMFEVLSSKMATEKATKADVKAFAEKMVQDHTKANDELKAAAAKAGIPVPSTLAPHHEKMLEQLKTAQNFDAAYMDAQLKAHQEAVDVFAAGANGAKDPGIKAFAEKTLPIIKMHYEHAKKYAGAGTGTRTGGQ